MKHMIASLLTLSLSWLTALSAADAVVSLKAGNLNEIGSQTKLTAQGEISCETDGFAFDGQKSFLFLQTPQKLTDLTIMLQVNLKNLPQEKAALIARRGFHNLLAVDSKGFVVFELWNQSKNGIMSVRSETALAAGQWYNLAVTVAVNNGQTTLKLYLTGKLESEKTFDQLPFDYAPEILVGSSNPWSGGAQFFFDGKLNNVEIYAETLDGSAIQGLLKPFAKPVTVSGDNAINITDFGAVADDRKDDSAAVGKAINYAVKNKIKTITFTKGTYDFFRGPGQSDYDVTRWVFFMQNISGLEIDGQDSTFMLHGYQYFAIARDCRNLTFKNFKINYSEPFFAIGKVTKLAEDKSYFELMVNPEYQAKDNQKVEAFVELDASGIPANPGLDVYYRTTKTQLLSPQLVRVPMTDTINVTPGKTIMLRYDLYTASLFRFLHGSDIKLQNIDIYMATGMGIVGQYIHNFTVDNVKIQPAPGSSTQMSIPSDGINLLGCSGKIMIQNSVLDGMGDDCVNIFSNYWAVKQIVNAKTCVLYNERYKSQEVPQEKPGDTMEFLSSENLQKYASRVIRSSVINPQDFTATVTFTEDLPANLKLNDDLVMKANTIESVMIQNNVFRPLRGRGICIQVPNVTVENNLFKDCNESAIHISTVISPWFEAGPVSNVLIQNNRFVNCMRRGFGKNSAVIQIGAVLRNREKNDLSTVGFNSQLGIHRDIKILNNQIEGSRNGGMVINSVENVQIIGNTIRDTSQSPVLTWQTRYDWSSNAVTMLGAHNVVFKDNAFTDSANPGKPGTLAIGEGCEKDQIKLDNNQNFDVQYRSVLPQNP